MSPKTTSAKRDRSMPTDVPHAIATNSTGARSSRNREPNTRPPHHSEYVAYSASVAIQTSDSPRRRPATSPGHRQARKSAKKAKTRYGVYTKNPLEGENRSPYRPRWSGGAEDLVPQARPGGEPQAQAVYPSSGAA